jgi:phosphatidate cytidylyltransferase
VKTLIVRGLSGAVYVALILFAVLLNTYVFAVVFAILSALTTYEFHILTNKQEKVAVEPFFGAMLSLLMFAVFFMLNIACKENLELIDIIYPIILILFLICPFYIFIKEIIKNKSSNPVNNIAYTFLGQIYIALPFAVLNIVHVRGNSLILVALFVIIWANDTFAYLVGSVFGKHRLCERISPKKSWEGFFGGTVGALIVGYVFSLFVGELGLLQWLVFALIIVIFGTLGDLFESLIKRTAGVKDSGNIMPGHGGFLDRFDSLLFVVMPIVIFLLVLRTLWS